MKKKEHKCNFLLCDGKKYKELNGMSLCEYSKNLKKLLTTYEPKKEKTKGAPKGSKREKVKRKK